jgi:uncharacterized membrane protein
MHFTDTASLFLACVQQQIHLRAHRGGSKASFRDNSSAGNSLNHSTSCDECVVVVVVGVVGGVGGGGGVVGVVVVAVVVVVVVVVVIVVVVVVDVIAVGQSEHLSHTCAFIRLCPPHGYQRGSFSFL